jgi:uncharacterized membrane protein YdjX (TVP38/TMEM64 family)
LGHTALIVRITLVLGVIGLMGAVYASGLHQQLSVETVQLAIQGMGAWGILAFLVGTSLLQPMHISIYLFLGAALLVWGPWLGGFLVWVATLGSAAVSFAFARYLAREWVQDHLPYRLRRFDDRLDSDGLRTIILLRLMFFTTPMVQMMLGVSRVKFRTYMLGTAIGNVPMLVFSVAVGNRLKEWLGW